MSANPTRNLFALPTAVLFAGAAFGLGLWLYARPAPGERQDGAGLPSPSSASGVSGVRRFTGISMPRTQPPLGVVADNADGTLYSRDINRINDAVDVGFPAGSSPKDMSRAQSANQTWLATEEGVRCIDRLTGRTRLYRTSDGLPGTHVVAIAADAQQLWCVVCDTLTEQSEPKAVPRLHLCLYDVHSDRWQERSAFDGATLEGRCLLSLNQRYVVVLPCAFSRLESNFPLLLDRQSSKFAPLPWGSALPADDNDKAVYPTYLASDEGGVTVGCDWGLLRWNFAEKTWHRLLPDRFIDCAATDAGGDPGTVWVASHVKRKFFVNDTPTIAPEWALTRVTLANGATMSALPPDSAMPSAAPQTAFRNVDGPVDAPAVPEDRWSPPCGLFVDGGVVWMAHRSTGVNAFNGYPAGEGLRRFDSATGDWTQVVVTPEENRFPAYRAARTMRDSALTPAPVPMAGPFFPRSVVTPVASKRGRRHAIDYRTIPEGAVRPLALRNTRPLSPETGYHFGGDSEQGCIFSAYRDWLSLPTATNGPGGTAEPGQVVNTYQPLQNGVPDPDDASRVWAVGRTSRSLIHCLTGAISTPGSHVPVGAGTAAPNSDVSGQSYLLPSLPEIPNRDALVASHRLPPRSVYVTQLLPVHHQVYCVLTDGPMNAVARLDSASGKWTLYDASRGMPLSETISHLIGDGADGAYVESWDNVYRYDSRNDRWQHLFESEAERPTHPLYSDAPVPPALFGKVQTEPKICVASGEADMLISRPSEPNGRQYPTRYALMRFDNRDGHLIAEIPLKDEETYRGVALALTGKDDLWVGMNHGLYRLRRDAPPEQALQPVPLPIKSLEGQMESIHAAPDGGLWIVTSENAYLWRQAHT